MSLFDHPLFLGRSSTPLRGVWVRNERTGAHGFVAHCERPRNYHLLEGYPDNEEEANEPVLWVVYPPDPEEDRKTWVAAGASATELKRKKGWSNYYEPEPGDTSN